MPLVEQELLTLPKHMSSPPVFSGVRVCIFYCNGVILVIEALDEMFTNIMIPMLKLHTNYGFHELFLIKNTKKKITPKDVNEYERKSFHWFSCLYFFYIYYDFLC
jgi:hypothetical protein